ncbi:MAG: hypothetical protein RIS44_1021 [Pseudomonadota bacterium]
MYKMHQMQLQRRVLLVLPSLLVGVSACATSPRTLTFSQADLTRWAQSRFPMDRKMLEVLDLTLSNPQFNLRPESNRLAAALDLSGKDRLFGRNFTGQLAFDGGLLFDANEQAVRLVDVKVSELKLEGLPPTVQSAARGLGPLLVQQVFERQPLYRFKPEDLQRAAAAGLKPGSLQITGRGIELSLVPLNTPAVTTNTRK